MKTIVTSALILIACLSANAQVPNPDFENWTNHTTYDDPNGWATLNSQVAALGQAPVTKETDAKSGSYAAKVKVVSVGGTSVPGILTLGNPTANKSGVPFAQRPTSISGWVKYDHKGGDSTYIIVYLSKQGNLIGIGLAGFTGTQSTYTQFTLPLIYQTADNPDTINISFETGHGILGGSPSGTVGTYCMIDNLTLAGVSGVEEQASLLSSTVIYPNPAKDKIAITIPEKLAEAKIEILNLLGEQLSSGNVNFPETSVNTSQLAAGSYLIKISNKDFSVVKKLIIE